MCAHVQSTCKNATLDRQTDRQTDRQADRQTDRSVGRQIEACTHRVPHSHLLGTGNASILSHITVEGGQHFLSQCTFLQQARGGGGRTQAASTLVHRGRIWRWHTGLLSVEFGLMRVHAYECMVSTADDVCCRLCVNRSTMCICAFVHVCLCVNMCMCVHEKGWFSNEVRASQLAQA